MQAYVAGLPTMLLDAGPAGADHVDACVEYPRGKREHGRVKNQSTPAYPSTGALLREALAELQETPPGRPSGPAVRALIDLLAPVVHARVARVFLQHAAKRPGGTLRQEIEDQVQATFVQLFARQGHVLHQWEEGRGLSLANWVGRLARLRALDAVRSGMRGPWHHDATEPEFFEDRRGAAATPECVSRASELWAQIQRRVHEEESEAGQEMFRLLFVQDLSTQEVRELTGKSEAAIFKWKSRLRKSIAREIEQLVSEVGDGGE